MQIAPGADAARWKALKLDDPGSQDWQEAVNILSARIQARYIEPVDVLVSSEETKSASERRFGFTVLAIDCLLVETLGAFIEGLEDTEGRSRTTFCKFLRTRKQFAADFAPQGLAEKFYKEIRCGILHQAETGGDSKVWSVGQLLSITGSAITVDRTQFHKCLKEEFEAYLGELRDPSNLELREKFRKKMNFIARL